MDEVIHIIEEGKVLIDYGPVTMTVMAYVNDVPATKLCIESFQVVEMILKELSQGLDILRQYAPNIREENLDTIGKKMLAAVRLTENPKMTPMAAIAGSVADMIADWIFSKGATKVVVNNGGDIAIRLAEDEEVSVGIMPDLLNPEVSEIIHIKESDKIGGIATSGLNGRSLTCGIANSVSVFAENGSIADALATHIANSSYISSPNVIVKKAKEIDWNSDIADQDVVVSVGTLTPSEIEHSLSLIEKSANYFKEKGRISFVAADVGGQKLYYPPK
ncbi:MAG: hypothetical protein K0R21_1280 [Anaerocolumna sp.]|jgi:ApbE superfamily uncharacterized protein (UPF0280 family)|nr:hypothetical protein [Anaerocolumna sp.]